MRLPSGFGFEWTEIALQEKLAGSTAILAFGLAVVFVFLLLAALYESWLLPLAVILIVPMCILAAMLGVNMVGLDRNILVEIGLTVLVALAAKNAILSLPNKPKMKASPGLRLLSKPLGQDCAQS